MPPRAPSIASTQRESHVDTGPTCCKMRLHRHEATGRIDPYRPSGGSTSGAVWSCSSPAKAIRQATSTVPPQSRLLMQ